MKWASHDLGDQAGCPNCREVLCNRLSAPQNGTHASLAMGSNHLAAVQQWHADQICDQNARDALTAQASSTWNNHVQQNLEYGSDQDDVEWPELIGSMLVVYRGMVYGNADPN